MTEELDAGRPQRTWLDVFAKRGNSPAGGGWEALLGARVVEVGEGRAVVELECGPQHRHNGGIVQGGIITTIADASMGMALMTMQPVGKANTTIELKINFLRPQVEGRLRAEGRVVKMGRTLLFADATVTNGQGKVIARATSTCLRIDSPPRPAPEAAP